MIYVNCSQKEIERKNWFFFLCFFFWFLLGFSFCFTIHPIYEKKFELTTEKKLLAIFFKFDFFFLISNSEEKKLIQNQCVIIFFVTILHFFPHLCVCVSDNEKITIATTLAHTHTHIFLMLSSYHYYHHRKMVICFRLSSSCLTQSNTIDQNTYSFTNHGCIFFFIRKCSSLNPFSFSLSLTYCFCNCQTRNDKRKRYEKRIEDAIDFSRESLFIHIEFSYMKKKFWNKFRKFFFRRHHHHWELYAHIHFVWFFFRCCCCCCLSRCYDLYDILSFSFSLCVKCLSILMTCLMWFSLYKFHQHFFVLFFHFHSFIHYDYEWWAIIIIIIISWALYFFKCKMLIVARIWYMNSWKKFSKFVFSRYSLIGLRTFDSSI